MVLQRTWVDGKPQILAENSSRYGRLVGQALVWKGERKGRKGSGDSRHTLQLRLNVLKSIILYNPWNTMIGYLMIESDCSKQSLCIYTYAWDTLSCVINTGIMEFFTK